MNWLDLSPMLADAATSPAMLLVCTLLVFVAGLACGWIARDGALAEGLDDDDAGDTHAKLPAVLPPEPPRPRVRAGRAPLPYSYDGRKHAVAQPTSPAASRH